jgi:hypothetical protein
MATKGKSRRKSSSASVSRTLDARPDTLDFRDKMYVPTLVEVPTRIDLQHTSPSAFRYWTRGARARAPVSGWLRSPTICSQRER